MSATVFTLSRDMAAISSRTRRSQVVSVVLHGAVLLWLILHRQLTPAPEQLVEVTWLEPSPVATSAPAAPQPASREVAAVRPEPVPPPTPAPEEVRFERTAEKAEKAPQPQDARASRDAVRARLESLQSARVPSATLAAAANPGTRLVGAATTNHVVSVNQATPDQLTRTDAPAQTTALTRRAAPNRRPDLAAAAPTSSALSRALPEEPTSTVAQRVLGSASLRGEVADRPVTLHEMPLYPDWATREAVEADVTLRFVVLPDGSIKNGIQVDRTAGFLDFDDAAMAALRRWLFAPLPTGQSGEQRGSITFHFRLRDQK